MIQFYKLVSGESIVARQVKKTKTEVEIDLPIQILEVLGDTEDGETAYVLSPWTPFVESQTVRLNKAAIILSAAVSESMMSEYEERVERYLSESLEPTEVEPEIGRRKCSTRKGGFLQQRKRRTR